MVGGLEATNGPCPRAARVSTTTVRPRVPAPPTLVRADIERAVVADEQRIAAELVDTIIRDLFGVGLVLEAARADVSGRAEQRLAAAVDGIDGVIRAIRQVVFALETDRPSKRPRKAADRSA